MLLGVGDEIAGEGRLELVGHDPAGVGHEVSHGDGPGVGHAGEQAKDGAKESRKASAEREQRPRFHDRRIWSSMAGLVSKEGWGEGFRTEYSNLSGPG